MEVAAFGERDEALGEGAQLLCASRGRLDSFVTEKGRRHVPHRGAPMAGAARQLATLLAMPHRPLFLASLGSLRLLLEEENSPVVRSFEAHSETEVVLVQEVGDLLE